MILILLVLLQLNLICFQLTENLSKSNRKFGNVNNRRTYAPILTYNE